MLRIHGWDMCARVRVSTCVCACKPVCVPVCARVCLCVCKRAYATNSQNPSIRNESQWITPETEETRGSVINGFLDLNSVNRPC